MQGEHRGKSGSQARPGLSGLSDAHLRTLPCPASGLQLQPLLEPGQVPSAWAEPMGGGGRFTSHSAFPLSGQPPSC